MQSLDKPVLAATVHDPRGAYLPALRRVAAALGEVFSGFGVLATAATAPEVMEFLERELDAVLDMAPPDGSIGKHRRRAVELAAALPPAVILYSDLDNVLRWIESDRGELEDCLSERSGGFVVIGRTDRAMKACPRRLRDTEEIINHIYGLATGRRWDLMFAIRMMSPAAARVVVEECRENSIGNDVEWPLMVERAGLGIAYREADGLSYRIGRDFETAADVHDADPLLWIDRVEIANLHAQAMKRILRP